MDIKEILHLTSMVYQFFGEKSASGSGIAYIEIK